MEALLGIFDSFIVQLPFVGVVVSICVWFYIQSNKQSQLATERFDQAMKAVEDRHAEATVNAHTTFAESLSGIHDECHKHTEQREKRLEDLTKRVLAELKENRTSNQEQTQLLIKAVQGRGRG
jgi:hypothetical protein